MPHGTSKVCFRSSQNTKRPFRRIRSSWYDAKNDNNFLRFQRALLLKKLDEKIILWDTFIPK